MDRRKIKIPIYFGDLIIISVKNWDEINKRFGTKAEKDMQAIVFKDDKDGFSRYVVAFSKKPDAAVIAHEATHIVNHIFIDRMMSLDPYNDEPQAYLTGWVVEQIDKFFNNKKTKSNGKRK